MNRDTYLYDLYTSHIISIDICKSGVTIIHKPIIHKPIIGFDSFAYRFVTSRMVERFNLKLDLNSIKYDFYPSSSINAYDSIRSFNNKNYYQINLTRSQIYIINKDPEVIKLKNLIMINNIIT